jgi:plasmid maintenance system killer protein
LEHAVTVQVEVTDDLRVPPGNRLEKLRGDHEGLKSIQPLSA